MLKLEMPKEPEKTLKLGDYVTVHMSSLKPSREYDNSPSDMQVYREELYQRIQKQRAEITQFEQRQGGDLIDVRVRGVA